VRSLEFDPVAFEDLAWCVQHDRKTALRLIRLIQETQGDPFGGIGKPEPLKHELVHAARNNLPFRQQGASPGRST
jgi:toxin YoeB